MVNRQSYCICYISLKFNSFYANLEREVNAEFNEKLKDIGYGLYILIQNRNIKNTKLVLKFI